MSNMVLSADPICPGTFTRIKDSVPSYYPPIMIKLQKPDGIVELEINYMAKEPELLFVKAPGCAGLWSIRTKDLWKFHLIKTKVLETGNCWNADGWASTSWNQGLRPAPLVKSKLQKFEGWDSDIGIQNKPSGRWSPITKTRIQEYAGWYCDSAVTDCQPPPTSGPSSETNETTNADLPTRRSVEMESPPLVKDTAAVLEPFEKREATLTDVKLENEPELFRSWLSRIHEQLDSIPTLLKEKPGPSNPQAEAMAGAPMVATLDCDTLETPPKSQMDSTGERQGQAQPLSSVQNPSVDLPKKKKKKGMLFDKTYMEYSGTFHDTCKGFTENISKFSQILDDGSSAPEDVRDEIRSALGQAHLLMESKLPQFAELLNSYLFRIEDPVMLLPCDLEGWWAVAAISVDKVKNMFEKLLVLESTNWTSIEKPKVVATKRPSIGAPVSTKGKLPVVAKSKPKPKASSGLRDFLAAKRNKIDEQQEEICSGSVEPTLSLQSDEIKATSPDQLKLDETSADADATSTV